MDPKQFDGWWELRNEGNPPQTLKGAAHAAWGSALLAGATKALLQEKGEVYDFLLGMYGEWKELSTGDD